MTIKDIQIRQQRLDEVWNLNELIIKSLHVSHAHQEGLLLVSDPLKLNPPHWSPEYYPDLSLGQAFAAAVLLPFSSSEPAIFQRQC